MCYWDLPGPRAFLETVEDQVRDGASVILAQPIHAPASLPDALRALWRDSGWDPRFVALDDQLPIDTLFDALGLPAGPDGRRDARELLGRLHHTDIVVVEDVALADWPRWRAFADEYERASRNVDRYERPRLLLLARGIAPAALGPPAPALKVCVLDAVISEIDMLVYADTLLRHGPLAGSRRRLAAAAIARLAAWDTRVADLLGALPVETLFAPREALAAMAVELGWAATDVPSWERGTVAVVDGRQQVHAALLALHDPKSELSLRLWGVQAAIILPLVEQHRRAIVERIRHRLSMPRVVDGMSVTDPFHLEVAELGRAAGEAQVDRQILNRIARLRYVRNQLAHMQLLAPADAMELELHAAAS